MYLNMTLIKFMFSRGQLKNNLSRRSRGALKHHPYLTCTPKFPNTKPQQADLFNQTCVLHIHLHEKPFHLYLSLNFLDQYPPSLQILLPDLQHIILTDTAKTSAHEVPSDIADLGLVPQVLFNFHHAPCVNSPNNDSAFNITSSDQMFGPSHKLRPGNVDHSPFV